MSDAFDVVVIGVRWWIGNLLYNVSSRLLKSISADESPLEGDAALHKRYGKHSN
jgi:hypothetical protein